MHELTLRPVPVFAFRARRLASSSRVDALSASLLVMPMGPLAPLWINVADSVGRGCRPAWSERSYPAYGRQGGASQRLTGREMIEGIGGVRLFTGFVSPPHTERRSIDVAAEDQSRPPRIMVPGGGAPGSLKVRAGGSVASIPALHGHGRSGHEESWPSRHVYWGAPLSSYSARAQVTLGLRYIAFAR